MGSELIILPIQSCFLGGYSAWVGLAWGGGWELREQVERGGERERGWGGKQQQQQKEQQQQKRKADTEAEEGDRSALLLLEAASSRLSLADCNSF